MLASFSTSMVNQKHSDLGMPTRLGLNLSRLRTAIAICEWCLCKPTGVLTLASTAERRSITVTFASFKIPSSTVAATVQRQRFSSAS